MMEPTNLKSIQQHLNDIDDIMRQRLIHGKTGIACEKCQTEMIDLSGDDAQILTTYPPQVKIGCPACKHTTFRYEVV